MLVTGFAMLWLPCLRSFPLIRRSVCLILVMIRLLWRMVSCSGRLARLVGGLLVVSIERLLFLLACGALGVLVVLWWLACVRILWFAIRAPGEALRILRSVRPGSPWSLPRR